MAQGDKSETGSLASLISSQDPQKVQALTRNMSAALVESQKLLTSMMGNQPDGMAQPRDHPLAIGSGNALARVGQSVAAHPERLMSANLGLLQGYMSLWQDMVSGSAASEGRDRRFSDPEWSENPAFQFMRRSYELNTSWLMSLVEQADELGERDKRKAKFLTQQTIDAFAPTNFFATNPAALRAMIESGGTSVVEGLKQAREDLTRGGKGKLAISQTDETPFKVGENVATAPGKVVFRNNLIELIQYSPTTETVHAVPLLIFPPWINKFYILDLREENSMIRWLVNKGLTVLVVSWRSADVATKDYTWEDYAREGTLTAVEQALEATGAKEINTIGYCIGGTLLSGVLAHMAKNGDDRIRSATFFASQSDFQDAGDLMVFTDADAVSEITRIIDDNDGIMPGEIMGETFNWMRPVDLVWRYVVDNYMMGKKPKPFDLLYWNADQTNIPGKVHLAYLKELYGHNALSRGEFKLFGETVSLNDVTIPITVQASRDDHICPYDSVYRTAQTYGGPVRFVLSGSGHIAGVVNHPDANKYQHWLNDGELPGDAHAWLDGAEELPGSWWPSWWIWLQPLSGRKVKAREPEDCGLGDAPGHYVTARMKDIAEYTARGEPFAVPAPKPVAEPKPAPKPKAKPAPKAKAAAETVAKPKATKSAAKPKTASKAKKPVAKKSTKKPAAKKKT
ncbi:MAG: class I poly(R)-hydroxyalkanoic acid synthase [Pseudomonadota bacterium]